MSARHRPVGAIDVAASALARLAPRRLHPHIDQARHDANAVIDGLVGRRAPSTSRRRQGPARPAPLGAIDPLEHVMPTRGLRQSYVSLRTDLRWLSRDLRGDRRPCLVERGPSRYVARDARPSLTPRPVRVVEVRRETADAVSVTLAEADGRPLRFEAGQFLSVHVPIDGQLLRRAYSLSRAPGDGASTITVKRIEGGRVSSYLTTQLAPGDTLSVLGPSGSFVAPALPEDAPVELVFVAGGSGITPVHSLIRWLLAERPAWRARLVYGNRAPDDVIFHDDLAALAASYPDRFALTHALERPPAGFAGLEGRLDRTVLEGWLDALPPSAGSRLFYLCGPAPMMDGARALLLARGVAADAIREERFQSPGATPVDAASLPAEPVTVQLRVKGREQAVRVAPGQTLLEAGVEAGAGLPFSCALGGCGACKGRLVAGEVVLGEPNCLTAAERDAGWVLTCCARPTSDDVAVELP